MSDLESHDPSTTDEVVENSSGAVREFLCLLRRDDGGKLVSLPMDASLLALLNALFLGDEQDDETAAGIAKGLDPLHDDKIWIDHHCDGHCGGVGRTVMYVGKRCWTLYLQRHYSFTNNNLTCVVERYFDARIGDGFRLPDPPGKSEEPHGPTSPGDEGRRANPHGEDSTGGERPPAADDAEPRRPNKAIALDQIPTCIDDPKSLIFSTEPGAGVGNGDPRGQVEYGGQRILFTMGTRAHLNRLGPVAPTRQSQVQALRELAIDHSGDSINLEHFVFDEPEICEAVSARIAAVKDTVPSGKLPLVYFVGPVADVLHTGPNETTLVMDDSSATAKLVIPVRIAKFARDTDLARAPYVLLLAATVDELGAIRFVYGYAHPIFSMSTWFFVDADGERDTIDLMLLELANLPITIRQLVVIEKDLFPIRGADGIPFLPDFRVQVACLLPSLLCFVETAGYRTLEYFRRKCEPHAVMRRNGTLIKHRTGRRPRELSDRVFRLLFRRLLTKRLGPLHQPSLGPVDLPIDSLAVPSPLRLRITRHMGRIRSWLLARLRRGE